MRIDTPSAEEFPRAQELHQAGRLDEAGGLYRHILESDPRHVEALHFLGLIAYQEGNLEVASDLIGQSITLNPDYADAHNNYAAVLCAQGLLGEAEGSLRRAIALRPDMASTHLSLGKLLIKQGHLTEAECAFGQAIKLNSADPGSHFNLGNVLKARGKIHEAEASYRQAIALKPDLAEAHVNLGAVLQSVGALAEAEDCYRRAIALNPKDAVAFNNLGIVLRDLDRHDQAVACYEKAIALDPDYAEAHSNLGVVFKAEGKITAAISCYERAILCKPDHAEAHNNLGNALKLKGDIAAAEAAFRRALEIRPDLAAVHSNLIFLLDFDPSQDQKSLQAERRRWAEAHAHPWAARIRHHGNDPDPERRLRIGYVSADFYNHSAAHAFGPVVLGFDPDNFEVTCYSGVKFEDETTERFRTCVDHWRDVRFLSDADLADRVRADGIDILVDLSGHSEGNRLLAFAEKPAPVQITAWGHGTGTGLKAMDYLLSDPVLVPPAERGLFAEEVFDLPSNFLYEPPDALPPVAALPAKALGHVTFGCLNRREKISPQSIALWSEILNAVPDSRLLIKARELSDDPVRTALTDELAAHGIGEDRLVLLGGTTRPDHLAAHNRIDIALDPFPQGGGISTADALWMGVPVVTLTGRTVSSRNAASILTAVGLDEFIAETADAYREIAIAAARDTEKLGDIRSGLRRKAERSPLGDAKAYVRAVEAAYRQMWRRKCATSRPTANVAE